MTARWRREDGSAVVLVVLVGVVLAMVSTVLLTSSMNEVESSARATRVTTAFAAAEAGLDDYIAKLTEDHQYYAHVVHPAESTRRTTGGAVVAAGGAWNGSTTWTYPSGKNAWRALENGYEYNLQIAAPRPGVPVVRIVATGRRAGTTSEWRAVEAMVRPASVADFQMIANRDISYGSTATTYGKLYAGIDETGARHNIAHDGTAYADVHAEGSITDVPTYRSGARGYDRNTIRTVIKNPVNFNTFTGSLVDLQRTATAGGIVLDDPTAAAWSLTFSSNGQVSVRRCTRTSGAPVAERSPTCGSATLRAVPTNGAIYSAQSVVVSGAVRGRATIGSNADVIVGGNLSYVEPGVDVLGLIARQEVLVPRWSPNNLSWSAATIAISGGWHSWDTTTTKGTMTFTGSTATNLGGYMNMFATRNYLYDANLLFLQPPYFPVLEEAYTVLFFREVDPSTQVA